MDVKKFSMDIYLHNTLTGEKEKFTPIKSGEVSMYNCGPTVYNNAHIGNFRTFILNDTLRRMFEYNGLSVNQVMNITDIDDKTIRKSKEEGLKLGELTKKYEDLFFDDLKLLNILSPAKTPRATENIPQIISLIEKLLEKGVAYKSSDGVYFDIKKSDGYGKLANLNLENEVKERINNDEYDKENARDFSLWKFHSPEDGDIFYDTPFGKGRPGWHIECSAMAINNLGETLDIHTGGRDLIFPHHTNEIAQSEAVTGKKFVNIWIHGEFMTVDGKKMSKSLNNIFTLSDLKNKNIDPLAFRYFVLGAHYRTPLNFTWEALAGAENALKRLRMFVQSKDYGDENVDEQSKKIIDDYKNKFTEYINDDLDMPKALALIWDLSKDQSLIFTFRKKLILDFDKVLGLKLDEPVAPIEIPQKVLGLVDERDKARAEKDWKKSDDLRQKIESLGFEISDTPEGVKVQKK